ncbi:hypothetical protein HZA26_04210 [Candidatus Nomurabacteria bacterium]|nr:hypothetical protein [Candidatus Nomurabacteria bacterium]
MPNNFKKFKKAPLILSVIFFVFSSALFYFLYSQTVNNYNLSEKLEMDLREEISKRDQIKNLDRSLKMVEGEIAMLETHFIKSSDVVPFLDMIEKMAPRVSAKAEVSLVDLAKDNSSLVVEVKVEGSFEAVYKFLILLEDSPYELSFTSANIRRSSDGDLESENPIPKWSAVFKVNLLSFIK